MTDETPTVAEQEAVPGPELVAVPDADEAESPSGYDIPADELDEEAPAPDPEPNAEVVFLVVVTPEGASFATSDVSKLTEILPRREATIVDMRRACNEVVHDVNAMQIAQQTVGLMQAQAQAMAEQQRSQKIAQKLASKGIHVPQR